MTELWNEVRDYYYSKFGTAPELVDIAPVLDILRLCASGSSNKSIATFLDEPEDAIKEIIDAYLGHMGWEHNLPFSPLKIYKALDTKDSESFKNIVVSSYGYIHPNVLDSMYNSSVMVDKLERLFDEKWI